MSGNSQIWLSKEPGEGALESLVESGCKRLGYSAIRIVLAPPYSYCLECLTEYAVTTITRFVAPITAPHAQVG